MDNEIIFLNNNPRQQASDVEWVEEFYNFLQGELPEGMSIGKGHKPQMSHKKAWSIIWYLQEHLPVLPSKIEKCDNCGTLYNSYLEGIYWESKGKNFCAGCDHLVPRGYDRGKR